MSLGFLTHTGGPDIDKDGSFQLQHISSDNYNVSVYVPGEPLQLIIALPDVVLAKMKQPIEIKLDIPSPKVDATPAADQ